MADGEHTGGMIALALSPESAARLAIDGGESLDELHLTLAYLGDDVTDWPPENAAALVEEMRERTGGGPIEARVMAHAVFNPDGHDGREPCAVYLIGDTDRIGPLRADIVSLLGHKVGVPAQHEPFLPHVTGKYGGTAADLSYTGPITFDRLRVALANDVTDLPLAGPTREAPEPVDSDDVERKSADDEEDDPDDRPEAAGVVLLAADTGRALMLQRALDGTGDDGEDDPAAGKWEFPGGKVEPDDPSPLDAAKREWSEEVGQPVPEGYVEGHSWRSPNGVYAGHALIVPSEDVLDLSAERSIVNPDDDHEQVAWWDLGDAMRNPALRRECQRTPWNAIRRSLAAVRKTTNVEEKGTDVGAEVKVAGDRDGDGIPDAKDPTPGGSPAAKAPPKKGDGKRRVASKAGEARYHLPIGSEIGAARSDDARKAQDDPKAQENYRKLLTANPRDYRKMLDGMNDAELQSLSRIAYSFKSSNPQVVQARVALAGALHRRGQDVNDFGGLGRSGGGQATHPGTATGARGTSSRRRGTSSHPRGTSSNGTAPGPHEDPSWEAGETWQARRARRTKLGLMGRSVPPAAKAKRGEGGRLMQLHIYEDGSWQYKGVRPDAEVIETADGGWVFVEAKAARRPADPWEAALQQAAEVKRAKSDDKGGTEDAGINNIGDLAAAIKRAKGIKDEGERDAARARIRKAAAKLKAPNMIPKDWGSGGGKGDDGKGKSTPPWVKGKSLPDELDTLDPFALAAYIEAKAMSPDPKAAKLREYWAHGAGRKKWRPGTGGDFDRLKRHLRKYVPAHMLNGLTANIHKLATGEWPGKNAHGGKSMYGEDVEVKTIPADLLDEVDALDPTGGDDDAVTLALDRYGDMADELTTEEEYEEALAREIDWDLLPDGTLERADGQDGHAVLDGDTLDDDSDESRESPSDDPDDALEGLENLLAG